jgi:hypothetical protein
MVGFAEATISARADSSAPTWAEYRSVPWFVWFAVALSLWAIASIVFALAVARVMSRVASAGAELLDAPLGASRNSPARPRPPGTPAHKPGTPIAHGG